jgi:hypothetical protein
MRLPAEQQASDQKRMPSQQLLQQLLKVLSAADVHDSSQLWMQVIAVN